MYSTPLDYSAPPPPLHTTDSNKMTGVGYYRAHTFDTFAMCYKSSLDEQIFHLLLSS